MPAHDTHDLYRQGRRAALLGCAVSLLLGLSKLAGGWFGHSTALIADAIHSFGDSLLSAVVWGVLHWSQRPADPEHPYGHSRAEAVAGSSVALVLVFSALAAGWQSLWAFAHPNPEPPSPFTLLVAATSFVANEGLFRYNRRVAQRTGSRSLAATAWDQRLDALTAVGIFLVLAITSVGGLAWTIADPVAGLAVAIVILVAGERLFLDSLNELMDAQASPEVVGTVRREAEAVPRVRGVEKLLVRKAGLEYLVDVHVEVDPLATVQEGHAIAHAVKDQVMSRIPAIKDVLVHIEPAPNRIHPQSGMTELKQ